MARTSDEGACDRCHATFQYYLVHCGFGDCAYAYSDSTCFTCLLDGWKKIPSGLHLKIRKKIDPTIEPYLEPAPNGGIFRASAVPRCPHCNEELDAAKAATYIEMNAMGTAKGWRWQRNWNDLYCIVIENLVVQDNWKRV